MFLINFNLVGNSFAQTNNYYNSNITSNVLETKNELILPYPTSIEYQNRLIDLLSYITEDKINDAINLLEITSKDDAVSSIPNSSEINFLFKGIPKNSDSDRREIAQNILNSSKDFGSVYFVLPNGDIYLGEPFEDQQQLPRLNFADREWYKGVNMESKTYISSVFMSASINAPAIAIAVPVHSNNDRDSKNDLLLGYWVGIIDLQTIDQIIKNLELKETEQIVILDKNGTELINSKIINSTYLSNIFNSSNPIHSLFNNTEIQEKMYPDELLQSSINFSSEKSRNYSEVGDTGNYSIIHRSFNLGDKNWMIILLTTK